MLHFPPGTNALARDAIYLALAFHITGGLVAIIAGYVAIFARKGGRLHRLSGDIFFPAMLALGGFAIVVAIPLGETSNEMAGAFVLYMVVSGWMTVRRPAGTVGRLERIAPVLGIAAAVIGLTLGGRIVATHPNFMAGAAFVMSALALMGVALDVRMIRSGGIAGAPRLGRHVWRMGVSLFVATGSFFLGQQKVMPAFIQGSPILLVLALAPLALMIYWLFRVRARRNARPNQQPLTAPV